MAELGLMQSITTGTVEIRRLMVGPRQMSIAIYRQLRESRLVAPDGSLNGEPWGYVNHCLEQRCAIYRVGVSEYRDRKHRHIIWQAGGELCRSKVWSADTLPNTWYRTYTNNWSQLPAELQERHRDVRATLAQLPQLFIGR